MLNPSLVPNRIILIESLAHETAHALLFGLTLGADLSTNGPNARYASPLRADARPIEGIVHATFVLARMVYALERLAARSALTEEERALVGSRLARHRESYTAGLAVVDAHARFTEAGAAIFQACRQAMSEPAIPPA